MANLSCCGTAAPSSAGSRIVYNVRTVIVVSATEVDTAQRLHPRIDDYSQHLEHCGQIEDQEGTSYRISGQLVNSSVRTSSSYINSRSSHLHCHRIGVIDRYRSPQRTSLDHFYKLTPHPWLNLFLDSIATIISWLTGGLVPTPERPSRIQQQQQRQRRLDNAN